MAIRLTETKLRQIIREEARRLVEGWGSEVRDPRFLKDGVLIPFIVDNAPVNHETIPAIKDFLGDNGLGGARVNLRTDRSRGPATVFVQIEHPSLEGGSIELSKREFRDMFLPNVKSLDAEYLDGGPLGEGFLREGFYMDGEEFDDGPEDWEAPLPAAHSPTAPPRRGPADGFRGPRQSTNPFGPGVKYVRASLQILNDPADMEEVISLAKDLGLLAVPATGRWAHPGIDKAQVLLADNGGGVGRAAMPELAVYFEDKYNLLSSGLWDQGIHLADSVLLSRKNSRSVPYDQERRPRR